MPCSPAPLRCSADSTPTGQPVLLAFEVPLETETKQPSTLAGGEEHRNPAVWPAGPDTRSAPAPCRVGLIRASGCSSWGPGALAGCARRSPIPNFVPLSHPVSFRLQFQDGSQPPPRQVPWRRPPGLPHQGHQPASISGAHSSWEGGWVGGSTTLSKARGLPRGAQGEDAAWMELECGGDSERWAKINTGASLEKGRW